MRHNYDKIMDFILDEEDGFQIDPEDPGNWTGGRKGVGILLGTKFGISSASYPRIDIKNMTEGEAIAIYRVDYLERISADKLPDGVDLMAVDCAVNQGVGAAIKALQEACDVRIDGLIGPKTLRAASGKDVLHRMAKIRAIRYISNPRFNRYGDGWLLRLFRCMQLASAWAAEAKRNG